MRKQDFLEALDDALHEREFSKVERKDIVEDYQAIIEEAIERGEEETEFIQKLGSVKEIVRQLKRSQQRPKSSREKWIAVSPFMALIVFFLLGFGWDLWHPAWLSFLGIPITAIALETKGKERLLALSPLVITVTFILIGTFSGLWDPFWSLYVLVFAFGLAASKAPWLRHTSVIPVISVAGYIGLFYLYPQLSWWVTMLVFLPVLPLVFFSGVIQVHYGGLPATWLDFFKTKTFWVSLLLLVTTSAVYAVLVWVSGMYHPTWLVFLAIPVGVLLYGRLVRKEDIPLVAFMPFIALLVFFLVGHFLDGYAYSWLAFLAIPIVAILTNQD